MAIMCDLLTKYLFLKQEFEHSKSHMTGSSKFNAFA